MFGSSNKLKPKYGKQKGFLPLPASFNRINSFQKQNVVILTVVVLILWFVFNPLHVITGFVFGGGSPAKYPVGHPLTSKYTIETESRHIYPRIEDAPLLRELTVHKLVVESKVRDASFPEIENDFIRSWNYFDDPNPSIQRAKEEDENLLSDLTKAKNYFKNQDKIVYKQKKNLKNYPKVIVVTAIDFEKYSLPGLTKIVQNRVDYSHAHSYGTYVRWYHEFLPALNSLTYLSSLEKSKWIRLTMTRAAMFAFPHAKWFWYIDQDGLIMDLSIDIEKYMLDALALGPIMQKEQAIIPPDGAIKTYKNVSPENVKLILTQSPSKIETNSFLVKNDVIGKAMLEFWYDKLYLTYPSFPYGPDSAITHILQWHPFILSKTAIVPARTISAREPAPNGGANEVLDFSESDFTVHWSGCVDASCEASLNTYHARLKSKS